MISASTLSDRRGLLAFIFGVIAVTAGVLMHMPMFLMGRHNHFMLAGMPMGGDMIVGMALIVGGVGVAAYGLLPRLALVLLALYGKETKGRDLRDLDPDGRTFAATGV